MYFLFIHLVSLPVSRYTSTVYTIVHYSTLFIAAISIRSNSIGYCFRTAMKV